MQGNFKYIPKLSHKEVEENHQRFSERLLLYKNRGLDFLSSREFILTKAAPLEGSILEIGSGKGYTTLCLAKTGYEFIAIDKDRESLKTTALNLAYQNVLAKVKLYLMDGKSLAFRNGSFKTVVAVGLFHHLTDVDKMFAETDRVLVSNGKAVLADFNREGMSIIDSVHREEGNTHEDSGISKNYVYSYFHGLGYEIRSYQDKCHWVLIAEKRIQP